MSIGAGGGMAANTRFYQAQAQALLVASIR
jgi:hypothetical protein